MVANKYNIAGEEAADTPRSFSETATELAEEACKVASTIAQTSSNPGTTSHIFGTLNWFSSRVYRILSSWNSQPEKLYAAQMRLMSSYLSLCNREWQLTMGDTAPPVAVPDQSDNRFKDKKWEEDRFYDFIKQLYLIMGRWTEDMITGAEGVDERTKQQVLFYVGQIINALAPSNSLFLNPELMQATLESNSSNLLEGLKKFTEDIDRGHGTIKIRQSDLEAFEVGVNLAITPGLVVSQNEICQIIQYKPSTSSTLKRPLLVVPPWINKYYVLDLSPEKSFIKWCVDQGHTVFLISWVNPKSHTDSSFEDYLTHGVFHAMDVIKSRTGEDEINTMGYCVGGTLLSTALAYAAKVGDDRIKSSTLLTTQVDFSLSGMLGVLMDADQIDLVEAEMARTGYLDGNKLGLLFTLLKANELCWPFFIKNYILGKEPRAFDTLHWNSDCVNLPAKNHSFYLRNCYLENNLANGRMEILGELLDVSKVTIPIYNLATRTDHIVPPESAFKGAACFGGPVRFVLGGSGHIAGVVNPPKKNKYQYWTSDGELGGSIEDWRNGANETAGSWWPDWQEWITKMDDEMVTNRPAEYAKAYADADYIEEAPGSYVKVRC